MVGAQRDDNAGPVDLIVPNTSVHTADRRGTVAEGVDIRGNQILRVGTDREIARLQRPRTIVVDAEFARSSGSNDATSSDDGELRPAIADLHDGPATQHGDAGPNPVLERREPGAGRVVERMVTRSVQARPADAPDGRLGHHGPAGAVYAADEGDRLVLVNSRALRLAEHHAEDPRPGDGAIIVRDGAATVRRASRAVAASVQLG